MEYEFFINENTSSNILEAHMPKEIYAEVAAFPVLSVEATTTEVAEPIGYAFFLMGNPTRLLWISVNEEYYGGDLAHLLLEYAEDYLRSKGVSGVFGVLYGDYFSTLKGNSFLNKNDFDVVNQNKILFTYKYNQLKENAAIKALLKGGDKFSACVSPLDNKNRSHYKLYVENAKDIRTDKADFWDKDNSHVFAINNKLLGYAVSIHRQDNEIYVVDFHVEKASGSEEVFKGLLATLLKGCIKNKDLCFITQDETQRNLLTQFIGNPDKNVLYREYYKGLEGREGDIDG